MQSFTPPAGIILYDLKQAAFEWNWNSVKMQKSILKNFLKHLKLLIYVKLISRWARLFLCIKLTPSSLVALLFFVFKPICIQNFSFFDTACLESSKWKRHRSQNWSAGWETAESRTASFGCLRELLCTAAQSHITKSYCKSMLTHISNTLEFPWSWKPVKGVHAWKC